MVAIENVDNKEEMESFHAESITKKWGITTAEKIDLMGTSSIYTYVFKIKIITHNGINNSRILF